MNCLYDPFDPGTVDKLNEFIEFAQFKIKQKEKFITYLILVYDRNSELFVLHADNLYLRKKEAALKAGFTVNTDKHFPDYVESVLVGENEEFNLCQFRYIRFAGVPDLPVLIRYLEMLDKEMSGKLPDDPAKRGVVMKNIEALHDKIDVLEQRIFTGRESEAARESLYRLIEKIRVPRPEFIAQDIKTKTLNFIDPYHLTDGKE